MAKSRTKPVAFEAEELIEETVGTPIMELDDIPDSEAADIPDAEADDVAVEKADALPAEIGAVVSFGSAGRSDNIAELETPPQQEAPGRIVAALESHNQVILAAIESVRESERARAEQQLDKQAKIWQSRLTEMEAQSEAALSNLHTDSDEAMRQLSVALEQVRRLNAQIETERRALAEANDRVGILTEVRNMAEQRATAAESSAAQARAEADILRRGNSGTSTDAASPPWQASISAAVGQWGAVVLPVHVTAVVGTSRTSQGNGIGIILDVRIAAAAPHDPTTGPEPVHQGIDLAIRLARAIQPSAALTVLVKGEADGAIDGARDAHPSIPITATTEDDRRHKAALILAAAARQLGHGETEPSDGNSGT